MAVIDCSECGASVSTEAKTCPGCGVSRKIFRRPPGARKPMSLPKKAAVAFGGLFLLAAIAEVASPPPNNSQSTGTESAAEKQTKTRDYAAYLSAQALKSGLRNPASVSFKSILANDDGSVICMTYRAQNGFGGLNLEHVVFKDGEPNQTSASWRKNCARKILNDVTGVARLIN